MSKKPKGLEQTSQVRLYPTLEQGRLLMAHCQEYISTVNVLVSALDADAIPQEHFSTKDFVAQLPSCVKNQALRDARSVFKRSLQLDALPVRKLPICQWNNQNWQINQGRLTLQQLETVRLALRVPRDDADRRDAKDMRYGNPLPPGN